MAGLTQEQKAEIREIFNMFDTNGDGVIDVDEIAEVVRMVGGNPSEAEIKDKLKAVDVNENGKVEYNEFEAMLSKQGLKSKDEEEMELKEAFRVFDRDGNGYVTASELRETMTTRGERLSEEEVDDMIAKADVNGDGKIEYAEFAKLLAH